MTSGLRLILRQLPLSCWCKANGALQAIDDDTLMSRMAMKVPENVGSTLTHPASCARVVGIRLLILMKNVDAL